MKKRISLILVALLLICGTSWGIWRLCRTDKLAKVRQLQAAMAKLPPDQRGQQFQQIRQAMAELTPAQREEAGRAMWQQRQRQMQRTAAIYAALPPDQKQAFLDKQIDEMERRRQEMEAARQQAAQGGAAGSQGDGQGGRGRGPGASNPNGNVAGQQRANRRMQMLDSSTPADRAQMHNYFQALQGQYAQRGMQPPGGRGGGFF